MMENTESLQPDEASREKTPKPFPAILPSIGWIVLYFLLQGICTGILVAAVVGGAKASNAAAAVQNPIILLWGLVTAALVQLLLMWFYLRKDGRIGKLGLNHFGNISLGRATGLAIVLVAAAMLFNYVYATYIIPGIGMQEDMAKMLASIPRTPVNIAAGFFAIAVAAPVVEELLFRGLLQNALGKYVPIWGAIILSSFLFALVHLQPYAIPGLMSLGIAFGYLYHRTGSLRTNILLHMANNAFALTLTQGVAT
ncbi:MAG: CPBP family intramembrane metalloprotease [Sphingomonadaceae bacterium]|nr:CPBP family intramembrane metalloprotease [Sphingomonadaceae bacterium]